MNAKISDLLQYVQTLRFYEEKLVHVQGDRFNVFDLFGVGSREVSTHTPYLVEFLNPKGVHGLGERPLAAFVQRFKLNLVPTTTHVTTNHYLGPVTDDSGGYIDILLTDAADHQVVIENKIFAYDQPNQLHRYQNGFQKARIIYLTRDGLEPSDFTTCGMTDAEQERILCLSYAKDIIAWQEECRCQAAVAPVVRETITQYINLIRRLTNQSTNTNMSIQIAEAVLKDEASLKAFYELLSADADVHGKILEKLHEQCDAIGRQLGLKVVFDTPLAGREGGFLFSDESMERQNISIVFEFEGINYQSLTFGIRYVDLKKRDIAHPDITGEFRKVFGNVKVTEWWPAFLPWQTRYSWTNETFADIAFGRFQPELEDKVRKLLAIVRAAQAAGK
jgi:hypothetical protein